MGRLTARSGSCSPGAPSPGPCRQEIVVAYERLGPGAPVAVRSSATAEDLAGASFAGQQDTYLNVRGHDALLAAVRDCWASLWTGRAMAYRARQDIDPATVRLAVVVQEMVPADTAGVMFTANPANGRRDEVVIGAAWGWGRPWSAGPSPPTTSWWVRRAGRSTPGRPPTSR